MVRFRKTRIAPTPSGFLHAGNAVNFLLTAALAKQCGADILLRIDDLDRNRYRSAYVDDIFETLHFLNIPWQQGPRNISEFEQQWSQQHRLPMYYEVLKKLRDRGCVFACLCSRTEVAACTCDQKNLSLDLQGASWRMLTDERLLTVLTTDGHIIKASLPAEMKNFIVRKKDGFPSYQLTSVVDDLHFGIDLIVRGDDLWHSTLAQQFLAMQLVEERFSEIRFYHHPLLKNSQGEKLSKSAGAASVKYWREQERSATAFMNYLGNLLCTSSPVQQANDLPAIFGL